MTHPPIRADVRERFRRVLERGIARADAEIAEELAKLKPEPRPGRGVAFRYAAGKRPR